MSVYTQNWDGVAPGGTPASWTLDTPLAVSGPAWPVGFNPTSPTQCLKMIGTGVTISYATYGVNDGSGGNVDVWANFNTYSIGGTAILWGVFGRGSSNDLGTGTPSYYAAQVDPLGNTGALVKMVSGSITTVQSSGLPAGGLTSDAWYTLHLSLGGSTLTMSLMRISDGYWLTAAPAWQSTQTSFLTATDTSIATSGTTGLYLESYGATSYSDDFNSTSGSGFPARPCIVPVPFGWYPANLF